MKFLCSVLIVWSSFATAFAADDPQLTIERLTLHQSEDGPSVPAGFGFAAGDPVYFSCQLNGYKKVEKDEKQTIDLSYAIQIRDARGVLLVPVEKDGIASTLSFEDMKWMPKVRFSFSLPSFVEAGQFQIVIDAKDQNSGKQAHAETKFQVDGRNVAPSDTLIVRNFRFLRGEEDKDPLETAAYRRGDTVWARFDMTGYKLGEGNAFDLDYGLSVLRPNGEVAYSMPRAAEEKNQSFYPERYSPGVLSLTVPNDMALGQYTIVLTVHDNLGQQSYETKEKFSVE